MPDIRKNMFYKFTKFSFKVIIFILACIFFNAFLPLMAQENLQKDIKIDVVGSTGSGSKSSSSSSEVIVPVPLTEDGNTAKGSSSQALAAPVKQDKVVGEPIKEQPTSEMAKANALNNGKENIQAAQNKANSGADKTAVASSDSKKDSKKTDAKPKSAADLEPSEIESVLKSKQEFTLASYRFDVPSMKDPFMPIAEVLNVETAICPEGDIECCNKYDIPPNGCGPDGSRPYIETVAYSQLKLVAITILSGSSEGLASFEDGAGASYILRTGDRIGRNGGVISKIEAHKVVIEEPARGKRPANTVEILLNVLDTSAGLTIESSKSDDIDAGYNIVSPSGEIKSEPLSRAQ